MREREKGRKAFRKVFEVIHLSQFYVGGLSHLQLHRGTRERVCELQHSKYMCSTIAATFTQSGIEKKLVHISKCNLGLFSAFPSFYVTQIYFVKLG